MKMNSAFILLFLVYNSFSGSCTAPSAENQNDTQKDTSVIVQKKIYEKFEPGKVTDPVTCSTNQEMSFAVYLPSNYSTEKKYPVIAFFDPHASGKLPVEKYKELAEKYGYIIACSNNSQNGMMGDKLTQIYTAFLNDLKNRFSIDEKRFYLGGFSGGARVASSVILKEYGYAGMIGCGAGWTKVTKPLENNFTYISFAGNQDFNLTELRALNENLDSKKIPHVLIEFEGKHEWPPAEIMENAFIWLLFDAVKKNIIPKNDSLVSSYISKNEKEIKKLESKKELYKLYNAYTQLIAFTEGLTDNSSYKTSLQKLSEKEEMKKVLQEMEAVYSKEEQLKQDYAGYMQSKDDAWWNSEMVKINSIIKTDKDKNIRAMYQRVLAYLSLMAYSSASGAIKFNELKGAEHFLTIYKLVDPENPEHAYLSALVYMKQNKSDDALASLKESVKLGFNDYNRLMAEKDFVSLKDNAGFKEIVQKIKPQ